MQADEFGIKLEIVQGAYSWEFFPSPLHQGVLREIDRSVRPTNGDDRGCRYYTLSDAYVRFPDGSLKRPDLMIFCEKPMLTRDALTTLPAAIVEVLSPGGDHKDLVIGPQYYLSQAIKDIVVVHPEERWAKLFQPGQTSLHPSPSVLQLQCGCDLTV